MKTTTLTCSITLPDHFKPDDFLAFHQRDKQAIAEKVQQATLHKGLYWATAPACLTLTFTDKQAQVQLDVDGIIPHHDSHREKLIKLVENMLGLLQPIEAFEHQFRHHPVIGTLITHHSGLRIPQTAQPFEAMSWAIIGQQISVNAATAIRRRFIQSTASQHSQGLWCYPTPEQVAVLPIETLLQAGFSHNKAQSLLTLSKQIVNNDIITAITLDEHVAEALKTQLMAIKGIGQWTVNYILLRGYNWLDASLHGDVAVRRNLQLLLKREDKLSVKETEQWLLSFSPWRALVAAHLWAQQNRSGY